MNQNKKIIPIQPEVQPEPLPEKTDKAPPTMRYIIQYTLILLCGALVLILLSYLSNQQQWARENQQQWADMQEEHNQFSVSALQSIQSLLEENARFEEENAQLQQALDAVRSERDAVLAGKEETDVLNIALQGSLEDAGNETAKAIREAEKQRQALEYLWRADVLVTARRLTAARELLTEMRALGLPDHLPKDALEGIETADISPAEEYERLAEMLIEN